MFHVKHSVIGGYMKLKNLLAMTMTAVCLSGCATMDGPIYRYRLHPLDVNKNNLGYKMPEDCESLERNYRIALAWERRQESKHSGPYLFLEPEIQAAHMINNANALRSMEAWNSQYLEKTKALFLAKKCPTKGYVAFDGRITSESLMNKKGVHSCRQDVETGFTVCLKNK